ncbi:MAG: hypothetical protein QM831_26455 [Kofleriaceae bacterium]
MIRWKPPEPVMCGAYELDNVEISVGDKGVERIALQFGHVVMFYHAYLDGLPLVLYLTDCAAVYVDPAIAEEPFLLELSPRVWRPTDDITITIEASGGHYRCDCVCGTHRTVFTA